MVVVKLDLIAVVFVAFFIVRHPIAVDDAVKFRFEIANLSAKLHTARADDAGAESGVQIGGEVEVIREGEFQTVRTGCQRRNQQTALAMTVEREIRPRRIKHRNAAEHQRRVFCHAYARFLIGFDAFRFDVPTRITGRAGIEFGIDELVQPFAFHFRLFADALEAAAVFFGIDADVFARAGIVFQVVHQSIAADGRTVLIQLKAVARPDGIAGLVVIRPIGV